MIANNYKPADRLLFVPVDRRSHISTERQVHYTRGGTYLQALIRQVLSLKGYFLQSVGLEGNELPAGVSGTAILQHHVNAGRPLDGFISVSKAMREMYPHQLFNGDWEIRHRDTPVKSRHLPMIHGSCHSTIGPRPGGSTHQ